MKYLMILFISLFAISINAQRGLVSWYPAVDTCDDTETVTFTWAEILGSQGSLEIQIVSDSLSGANTGTVYVESSAAPNGSQWVQVGSDAFEVDPQTVYIFEDTSFNASRIRVRVVGSGTQSTKVQVSGAFKKTRY